MAALASDLVKTPQATLTSRELLTEPVTALLSVSDTAAQDLKKLGKFSSYLLWIANYDPKTEPTLPGGWPTWEFWQLTDTGRVDGISGDVDMNIFNGDVRALWQTAGRSPASIPA